MTNISFYFIDSDGQRSPPPSMVYGQGTTLMSPTMMYMSQYMNPYLQVGAKFLNHHYLAMDIGLGSFCIA